MKTDIKFTSIEEFQKHYFPDSILERLEKRISELDLEGGIKDCNKYPEPPYNRKTGSLIFYQTSSFIIPDKDMVKSIKDVVESFYKAEGYNVINGSEFSIEAKKQKEDYLILVTGYDNIYDIWITENPFSKVKL